MKNLSLPVIMAAAAMLGLPVPTAYSLEMRTWLSVDGRMLEAELVRQVGSDVELRDKDGKPIKIPKSSLSFGDIDYIEENAPADTAPKALGGSAKPKLPNPAKEVKIDTKAFKKEAGDFKINARTYRVCETPHFKIMYMKPTDPLGMAELAERLWIDTAFFHSTFIPKWHERKMAIVLVNDEEAFGDVGSWYADMVGMTDTPDAKNEAERIRKIWPGLSSGGVSLPARQADEKGVFSHLRVFRTWRTMVTSDSNGKEVSRKNEPIKGVWIPSHTNMLAADLLGVQTGGVKGETPEGSFAIFRGHAYYKEILLNGRSETVMAGVKGTGKDVSATGGFKSGKGWADDLKKMMKKGGEWTPNLDELFRIKGDDASQKDYVFAYAFGKFLESSPDRLTAFNKLCHKIDVAKQVPALDEIAKLYGYEDAAGFTKAWITWMQSTEFRD